MCCRKKIRASLRTQRSGVRQVKNSAKNPLLLLNRLSAAGHRVTTVRENAEAEVFWISTFLVADLNQRKKASQKYPELDCEYSQNPCRSSPYGSPKHAEKLLGTSSIS
jgi:hypothetical protein